MKNMATELDVPQSASFITLYRTLSGKIGFAEITTVLDSLDDHLAYRTFLVGHALSLADWAVWSALKSMTRSESPFSQILRI
jgi:glutamyl-tRNA synthetase